MAESAFYSFDEAMDELEMEEEELQGLISQGELKAYRDEDTMKLRREDILSLKSQGGELAPLDDADPATEPTIILPAESESVFDSETDILGMQTDEILGLDEMEDLGNIDEAAQTAIPTIELAMDDDDDMGLGTSEIALDVTAQEATSELGQIGMLDDDDDGIPTVLDIEEDELVPTVEARRSSRVSAIHASSRRGPVWPTVMVGLTIIPFILIGLMLWCVLYTMQTGDSYQPDYIKWLADMFKPQI